MTTHRTPPGPRKMKVREMSTGRVFAAYSIDAREMCVGHPTQYAYAPDDAPLGSPEPPPMPAAEDEPAPA